MRPTIFLLAIASAHHAGAQTLDPWQEYVTLARTVPPEFTADALLRIAGNRDTPAARRLPLLTEAFETASTATWKVKHAPAINNLHTDSREGMLSDAMALELDTLSLQCRTVRAVLALNSARARHLFGQIAPPRIPAYSCKDPLVARPDIYYQVAAELADSAFDPQQKARREHLRFIENLARTATSVTQLEPIAEVILNIPTDAEGLSNLVSAFVSALETVDVSDRAFRFPFGLAQRIWDMTEACHKKEISPSALIQAWRAVLVRHLGGARCADNVNWVQHSNASGMILDPLAGTFSFQGSSPISADEMKPLKVVDEAPEQHDYWQSAPAKNAAAAMRRLRESPARSSAAWQADALTLIQELEAWKPEPASSTTDLFQQKAMLYRELIPMAPARPIREQAVSRFVAFLGASALQRESPVEWYEAASRAAKQAGPAADQLWAAYQASGNPILALYARLRSTPQ